MIYSCTSAVASPAINNYIAAFEMEPLRNCWEIIQKLQAKWSNQELVKN